MHDRAPHRGRGRRGARARAPPALPARAVFWRRARRGSVLPSAGAPRPFRREWPRRRPSSGAPTGPARRRIRRRSPGPARGEPSTRGFEMRAGGVELAAADLEIGAEHEGHVRVVGADHPKRGGARVVRPVPLPDREQGLDPVRGQHGAVRLVRAHCLEPFLPEPRRLGRPTEHREHVGERDIRPVQSRWVSELLGALQGLLELRETLVAAAEIGEAAAQHCERPALRLPRADRARERERLLAERERLLVAPQELQPARVPRQRLRTLSRRRVRGTSSSARSDAARKCRRCRSRRGSG